MDGGLHHLPDGGGLPRGRKPPKSRTPVAGECGVHLLHGDPAVAVEVQLAQRAEHRVGRRCRARRTGRRCRPQQPGGALDDDQVAHAGQAGERVEQPSGAAGRRDDADVQHQPGGLEAGPGQAPTSRRR